LPLSEAFFFCLARTGAALSLGPSGGGALSDAVSELSRAYTRERDELAERSRGQSVLGARLAFFLPRDLVKMFGPLDEIRADLLARGETSLRVLDVGAGLGATSLGLSRYLRLHGAAVTRLDVTALERDGRALSVFEQLCRGLPSLSDEFVPIALEARAEDVSSAKLGRDFDMVLFGFVLNELYTDLPLDERLERRAQLLRDAASKLRPGGTLIVLEPALKESTRELMRVRDLLAARQAAPFVWAPCTRAGPCPMLASERDWCHQELPYALPPKLAQVAQGAGLRFEGLSYASLVLRNSARTFATSHDDHGPYRIVSERLESKGKLEAFGCGEAGYVRFSLLERDQTPANRAFAELRRGHMLRIAEPQVFAEERPSPSASRTTRLDKVTKVTREQ
jgi:SAM-dependent methyltransferase